MKFQKLEQTRIIGGAASLALLFALSGCGGGGGSGDDEIAAKGPPSHSNSQLASIGVSNTCELVEDHPDTGTAALRVITTIVDKSSGDDGVDFTPGGTTVRAKEKGKGKDIYETVGEFAPFTPHLGENTTDIQLCKNGVYDGPADTVSLRASISINVDNDNKDEYTSRCSDDPETDGVDEGKVVISATELDYLCSQ
jgi:hypothetical protein